MHRHKTYCNRRLYLSSGNNVILNDDNNIPWQPVRPAMVEYEKTLPQMELQHPLSYQYFEGLAEQLEQWELKELRKMLHLSHLKQKSSPQADTCNMFLTWYRQQPKLANKARWHIDDSYPIIYTQIYLSVFLIVSSTFQLAYVPECARLVLLSTCDFYHFNFSLFCNRLADWLQNLKSLVGMI